LFIVDYLKFDWNKFIGFSIPRKLFLFIFKFGSVAENRYSKAFGNIEHVNIEHNNNEFQMSK